MPIRMEPTLLLTPPPPKKKQLLPPWFRCSRLPGRIEATNPPHSARERQPTQDRCTWGPPLGDVTAVNLPVSSPHCLKSRS